MSEDDCKTVHHVGEVDEARRKLLRDVEVKVTRYADKLEATGMSRSGKIVQDELEKYRQRVIEVSGGEDWADLLAMISCNALFIVVFTDDT